MQILCWKLKVVDINKSKISVKRFKTLYKLLKHPIKKNLVFSQSYFVNAFFYKIYMLVKTLVFEISNLIFITF